MNKKFRIRNRNTGNGAHVFVIADIGANHNGDLLQAKKLIRLAASCGVDAVKFQSYRADHFISKKYNPDGYNLITKNQIPLEWNKILKDYCEKKGVLFMTTPFDTSMVDYLEKLKVACYKIASCDITFVRLLRRVAETGKPVILSTGGSSMDEISNAMQIFRKARNNMVVLLHAVVNYPCDYKEINLRFMPELGKKFSTLYGLSDHSPGIEVGIAAAVLGAKVIEKHFTEDRRQKGSDHTCSLEPEEMEYLVRSIRNVEESMGKSVKKINPTEKTRMKRARRGIYADGNIKKGDFITENNILELRPKSNVGAGEIDCIVGVKAKKDIKKGDKIHKADLLL